MHVVLSICPDLDDFFYTGLGVGGSGEAFENKFRSKHMILTIIMTNKMSGQIDGQITPWTDL